jgi:membrane-associated PAP2 superfamily phosphatase
MTRKTGWCLLALAASAALILWIGQFTDIDLRLADMSFDRTRGVFPLQHAWFAEKFNHEILKVVLTCLASAAVVVAVWDAWRPHLNWAPSRRLGVRVLGLSAVSVPLIISLLKRASTSHCPWDVDRYGGDAPYIRLMEMMPSGISAGHCLPGGHASSALWLIALAAFWMPGQPRKAFGVATLAMAFALSVGFVQQLRGAHFLTHTLWSAWIACAIVLANYVLAKRQLFGYSSVPRNATLSKQ